MNMKFEKKTYTAPQMSVVEMRGQMNLLEGSTEGAPDSEHGVFDYDDELGFNGLNDINRKA